MPSKFFHRVQLTKTGQNNLTKTSTHQEQKMKLTGNTIFITGGGSGIGRGLAEALHKLGNQIIISGRRKSHLDATTKANPGMASLELNIEDPASIAAVTKKLVEQFPSLNALIDHLKKQESAVIIYNSSVLAYVPLALAAVYSSTKAALHSYTLSQRYKLKNTSVSVLEIAPPWVQTDLLGSNNDPRAMPLADFIEETIRVLGTDVHEVLVERAKPLRSNPGPNEGAFVAEFNNLMAQAPA